MKRFGRDMMVYAGADLLGSSIGLVLSPVFTRLFTPEQYGAQAALSSVWSFIALTQFAGMDSAYPVFRARSAEPAERHRIMVTASVVALISCVIVSGAFALVSVGTDLITGFVGLSHREVGTYALTLAPAAATGWFLYVLRYDGRAMAFARVSLVGRVLGALVSVPILFSLPVVDRVWAGFVVTAAIGAVAAALGYLEVLRASGGNFGRTDYAATQARPLLRFGLVLVPGAAVYAASSVLDRWLVTWFSGPEETAVLALAVRLGAVAAMLKTWFALVWDPQLVDWIAHAPRALLLHRLQRAAAAIGAAAALLVCLAALWAEPIVRWLYPPAYWPTISLLPWLVFGVAFSALSLVAVATVTLAQSPKFHLPVYGAALVVNLLLGLWWVPRLGATGAIIGTIGAEIFILLCWVAIGRWGLRNLPVSWWQPITTLGCVGLFLATYRAGNFFPAALTMERIALTAVFVILLATMLIHQYRAVFVEGAVR